MQFFMIELKVADWGRSLAWYTAVFGFKATLIDETRQFALLEGNGFRLALKGTIFPGGRDAAKLTLLVEDLDRERDRLVRIGVDVTEPEINDGERYRESRITDPDGMSISLFAWLDSEPGGRR